MMDFGLLPPEVTSARMYAGPGAGPLMAAATAWDALAAQLETVSHGYSAIVANQLDEVWSGPAAVAMARAALPFADWAGRTGMQAEQAAGQVRAAAAAFERALAAVVPPALVLANRTRLANLVATNIFGQNTAQIAATEAEHAAMWAQNTRAMYGYATSSATATVLTPFTEPPQTTNAAGQFAQSVATAHAVGTAANSQLSQAMSVVPQHLGALSTAAAGGSAAPGMDAALTASDHFNTLTGPMGFAEANARTATSAGSFLSGIYRSILQSQGAIAKAIPELAPATTMASVPEPAALRGAVLASVGQAEPIAGLSVPPRWAAAVPEPTAFAESPWLSEVELAEVSSWDSAPAAEVGGAGPMAGMGPLAGSMAGAGSGRATVSSMLRVGPTRYKMPRPALGG